MFKDTKEELQRLEKALLEKEDETMVLELPEELVGEEPPSAPQVETAEEPAEEVDILDDEELMRLLQDTQTIGQTEDGYQNYSNNYGRPVPPVYNTDKLDTDLDALSDAVEAQPRRRSLTGLVLLALLLVLGILLVLAWWLFRLWGIL